MMKAIHFFFSALFMCSFSLLVFFQGKRDREEVVPSWRLVLVGFGGGTARDIALQFLKFGVPFAIFHAIECWIGLLISFLIIALYERGKLRWLVSKHAINALTVLDTAGSIYFAVFGVSKCFAFGVFTPGLVRFLAILTGNGGGLANLLISKRKKKMTAIMSNAWAYCRTAFYARLSYEVLSSGVDVTVASFVIAAIAAISTTLFLLLSFQKVQYGNLRRSSSYAYRIRLCLSWGRLFQLIRSLEKGRRPSIHNLVARSTSTILYAE